LAKHGVDFLQLFIAEPPGTTGAFPFHKASEALLLEATNPIFHRPRRVSQESTDLRTAHPLGHQQYTVEAVVVS
jgi:hypothetical protein